MIMQRICLLAFFLVLFSGLLFSQTDADPAALYATADVVFTGRLDSLARSAAGLSADFKAGTVIKGQVPTQGGIRVQLPAKSDCHPFVKNHSYLIYAQNMGDELHVDPCAGSKLLSMAEADLRYLHGVNPRVSERCTRERLAGLAAKSPIVATAQVTGTEDTDNIVNTKDSLKTALLYRPWCGLVFTTEDAYYSVLAVIKGQIPESTILVEHPICWDTITVDGYDPNLSPRLFSKGNVLVLFLKPGSHWPDRTVPAPFQSVYESTDEDCGAILADDDGAQAVIESMRLHAGK